MTGYRPERRVYRLRFEDPGMSGLVVRARSAPVGQFMGLVQLADQAKASVEDVKRIDELFRGFADCLLEWNLEDDDGQPVPPTIEGLYGQDMDFALTIIFAWIEGIVGVTGPLGNSSSDGGRSEELSIPMEPLSPNHRSWQTQSSS
jgi:hypothetical protein